MRLWSIHPRYLDAKGLVAAWREALLARKVLQGETKGYQQHPQLIRFRATENPLAAVERFLWGIYEEACVRGYHFDVNTLDKGLVFDASIPVHSAQMAYEFALLKQKLAIRDASQCAELGKVKELQPHPLFEVVQGDIETWEKVLPQVLSDLH